MYKVTLAQETDDLEGIVKLILDAASDVAYLGVNQMSHERILDTVIDYVVSPIDSKALFVLWADDIAVGILAGSVNDSHPIFGEIKIVTEVFWYVRPEHRGKRSSFDLVENYELWARKIGASFASMCHFHDETGSRLEKVYSRLGYKPIEHVYIKKL